METLAATGECFGEAGHGASEDVVPRPPRGWAPIKRPRLRCDSLRPGRPHPPPGCHRRRFGWRRLGARLVGGPNHLDLGLFLACTVGALHLVYSPKQIDADREEDRN